MPDQDKIKNFKDKAYTAIDKAESVAKNAIDDIEWRAKSRVDQLESATNTVSEKVVNLTGKLKGWGNKLNATERLEQVEKRITSNPLASTAVAFGVGYLFSRLFTGRKDS